MLRTYAILLLAFISFIAKAQTPDSLLKSSPVKTLTDRQYNALIKGEDIYGMSLVADLNGYPSAAKALKYKKEIDLSPAQTASLNKIAIELTRKKVEMGGFIVTNETKMESMFRAKKLNEGDLIFYTNRYGLYMGELRNAILQAAFKAYQMLTPQQINKLKAYKNDI